MIEFTEQQFREVKERGEALYKSLGEVFCPFLIDNGQKFFWSIVPFWGMNVETMRRILHDGMPEED